MHPGFINEYQIAWIYGEAPEPMQFPQVLYPLIFSLGGN